MLRQKPRPRKGQPTSKRHNGDIVSRLAVYYTHLHIESRVRWDFGDDAPAPSGGSGDNHSSSNRIHEQNGPPLPSQAPSENADPGSGSLPQPSASTILDDPLVIFDRILELVAHDLPKHNEAIRRYRKRQYRESAQSLNEALALAKEAQYCMFILMVAVCWSKS
ncbi:hypothetical protein DL771_003877 [Monosporascus sp. 5C6A]|nr:hypothetical protein DL771_003877 [Monosporascus sp. 5C6A]